MKQRFKPSPRLGKKSLSTEERTKLFWPLVARDFERQALQTGSVSTRQNYSPAVSRRSVSRQDGRGVLKGRLNSIILQATSSLLDNRLALASAVTTRGSSPFYLRFSYSLPTVFSEKSTGPSHREDNANSAFPLHSCRAYPSAAFASGYFSIMGAHTRHFREPEVSCESVGSHPPSLDAFFYRKATDWAKLRLVHRRSHDHHVPFTPRPPTSADMAFPLGAVARITPLPKFLQLGCGSVAAAVELGIRTTFCEHGIADAPRPNAAATRKPNFSRD